MEDQLQSKTENEKIIQKKAAAFQEEKNQLRIENEKLKSEREQTLLMAETLQKKNQELDNTIHQMHVALTSKETEGKDMLASFKTMMQEMKEDFKNELASTSAKMEHQKATGIDETPSEFVHRLFKDKEYDTNMSQIKSKKSRSKKDKDIRSTLAKYKSLKGGS